MNYIGKEYELVTRVITKCDKDYIGIHIQTNYDTYKFCVDDLRSCCELFGVQLFNYNNDVIFEIDFESKDEKDYKLLEEGYFLKEIEYCHERSKYPKKHDGKNILSLKITLKDTKLKEFMYYIDIYTDHEGYYPHNYLVEWNNYKNEGVL